uniref:Uncharacterized protein n=1 Tax=Opuntia streptacantha TaxID=393608 RepID=A0A7C8YMU7_OPUST
MIFHGEYSHVWLGPKARLSEVTLSKTDLVSSRPISSSRQVKYGLGVFRFWINTTWVYFRLGKMRIEYISVLWVSGKLNGSRPPFVFLFAWLNTICYKYQNLLDVYHINFCFAKTISLYIKGMFLTILHF